MYLSRGPAGDLRATQEFSLLSHLSIHGKLGDDRLPVGSRQTPGRNTLQIAPASVLACARLHLIAHLPLVAPAASSKRVLCTGGFFTVG